jgi:hypothetical protein
MIYFFAGIFRVVPMSFPNFHQREIKKHSDFDHGIALLFILREEIIPPNQMISFLLEPTGGTPNY